MFCEPSVCRELELPERPLGIDNAVADRVTFLPCLDSRSSSSRDESRHSGASFPLGLVLKKGVTSFLFYAPCTVLGFTLFARLLIKTCWAPTIR